MQAWVTFTVTALGLAAILALFLSRRKLLLLAIAAAAGIVATIVFDWLNPQRHGEGGFQLILLVAALCAVAAILATLWPRKAWQWGLVPLLAGALWQVMGPYSTVHWGKLGPIPYVFPFFSAVFLAIPPMIAAEVTAYFARRRQRAA